MERLKTWEKPEEEPRGERYRDAEAQYPPVQVDLGQARQVGGLEGRQKIHRDHGENDPEQAADRGEDEALDRQLRRNPTTARSQCRAK